MKKRKNRGKRKKLHNFFSSSKSSVTKSEDGYPTVDTITENLIKETIGDNHNTGELEIKMRKLVKKYDPESNPLYEEDAKRIMRLLIAEAVNQRSKLNGNIMNAIQGSDEKSLNGKFKKNQSVNLMSFYDDKIQEIVEYAALEESSEEERKIAEKIHKKNNDKLSKITGNK